MRFQMFVQMFQIWTLKIGEIRTLPFGDKKTGLTSSESMYIASIFYRFLLFLGYFKETKCRPKQNIQASKTPKLFGTSPDLPHPS
jgi:hypothetical protein